MCWRWFEEGALECTQYMPCLALLMRHTTPMGPTCPHVRLHFVWAGTQKALSFGGAFPVSTRLASERPPSPWIAPSLPHPFPSTDDTTHHKPE